jgi:alkanesulfonate monooxygenase SsuD/methylene tetrahydromethanopterin reductase-like flavin-dependent oxidoreductase (luciferase family)
VALATTYLFLSEDPIAVQSALEIVVSPAGAPSDFRDRLLIGTPQECVDRVRRLEAAGIEEVLVWPVRDELLQLRLFAEEVIPRMNACNAIP